MNGNYWYPSNGYTPPNGYISSDVPHGGVSDSVQNAHRLLGVYPFASATPSSHVARHLNTLTISAAPPVYMQQQGYGNSHNSSYMQAAPQHRMEYAEELNHLASAQVPVNDGGYWEVARNDAVTHLGEQVGSSIHHYQQPPPCMPHTSTYQTNAFANSVMRNSGLAPTSSPVSLYPYPPPRMATSSSSLAYALGPPVVHSVGPRTDRTSSFYSPEQSPVFFNDFLAQTTSSIPSQQRRPVSDSSRVTEIPRCDAKPAHSPPFSSPDPLTMGTGISSPLTSLPSTPSVTPRKRKPVVLIESPSVKRMQSEDSIKSTSSSTRYETSTVSSSETKVGTSIFPKNQKLEPYIEVPQLPKNYMTPSKSGFGSKLGRSKMAEADDDDLGGYGSEDEDEYQRRRESVTELHGSGTKSSGRRTGDRDERAPLEKFTTLLEDIFEAEDSLPADIDDVHSLPATFFSPLTSDSAHPQLHPHMIRKLSKSIAKVARSTKRPRRSSNDGTPNRSGCMGEVDPPVLARILKILERSVRVGEDIEPFGAMVPSDRAGAPDSPTKSKKSAAKGGKKILTAKTMDRRSRSVTPRAGERGDSFDDSAVAEVDMENEDPFVAEPVEADFSNMQRGLEVARDSVLAADASIALLGSDRLTKQLYSEDLITACLSTIKHQLSNIIYPFVEASSPDGHGQRTSPLLQQVVKDSAFSPYRQQISEIFQALSAVLPRINTLISADTVAMSDPIIIQVVYIAIGPFFVTDSNADGEGKGKNKESLVLSTLGGSAMRGLRLEALSLIRSVFANHEDQRSWIIEEILSSLIQLSDSKHKAGQFRLRDGRSIRTVSALLLQLVQTSAHDVRVQARRLAKTRQQLLANRSLSNERPDEPFLEDHDKEEIRLYTSGLDSATKAAKTIVLFLTQRSGKGKATKNSNEAEYRAIFDHLISDLLTVLFWPEWPAASLLLSIICKFMVASLDDVKTAGQNENNAARTMALDHLGVIAARLRLSMLKFARNDSEAVSNRSERRLGSLDEVFSAMNIQLFGRLVAAHQDISSHLCRRSSEDQACDSARELTAAMWGQELSHVLTQCNAIFEDADIENLGTSANAEVFGSKVKDALWEVWKDPPMDVFDVGTQQDVARIDQLAEEIGTIQGLKNMFQPILNVVISALDAPPVFMRTKALRALGQIVTSDPSILAALNVRRAIETHLLDSSSAVRDAAVELIGKYMIDSPVVAGDYYQKIADRIADTGLGVRKRVIKLLKSFYCVTDNTDRRIDICTKLVLRMFDEDDTVKDLAIKTVEELWFSASASSQQPRNLVLAGGADDKSQVLVKVVVIMGVSANFKDRQSPLEDMLHKVIADKEGVEAASLRSRYEEICETLIDGLVDASDLPGFTVVNCIKTIYLFTTAYPSIITGANASTLLPYLKNATSPEEQIISDYLLKIFRAAIPGMPKTAVKFGHELQLALQPMIVKPSTSGGLPALQETVACMCTVVQNLTHDFVRLVALLKSCNARLQQAISKPTNQAMTGQEVRALSILIFIVSLLGEHTAFDTLRSENSALAQELDSISNGSIIHHIYSSLLKLYDKHSNPGLRSRILQCLGFLFRAQPTLMTLESSATIMDAIFSSPEEEVRGRLLKIIQDFLLSQASKHSAKEKENIKSKSTTADVNMEELVGNTDGFADSGVSSAVVQRYLDSILKAALSQHVQIQAAAVDILSFTIRQGLAHPLQSFPVIVALETSPTPSLSSRANALHAVLHSKHMSLLNSRYIVSARACFDYQKAISTGPIQGYRMQPTPTALMHRWYSLVREKRASRQEFLKALVKAFDVGVALKSSQDDVDFIRFMLENFSAFDYKTQEEVLTVIKHLTFALSNAGMQLVEVLSPSHLLTQLRGPSQSSTQPVQMDNVLMASPQSSPMKRVDDGNVAEHLSLMRTSVIIGMIMLLKGHLKNIYSLSEDKCSKWVLGKKNAIGDKAATKRRDLPISWDRLPFATMPILTSEDIQLQKTRFLEVWSEDGVGAEPDDDFE